MCHPLSLFLPFAPYGGAICLSHSYSVQIAGSQLAVLDLFLCNLPGVLIEIVDNRTGLSRRQKVDCICCTFIAACTRAL